MGGVQVGEPVLVEPGEQTSEHGVGRHPQEGADQRGPGRVFGLNGQVT